MNIQENVPLAQLSNYHIGGPARFFCAPENVAELRAAVAFARDRQVRVFVLGGGTNILIADEGFGGLVIRPAFTSIARLDGDRVRAGAGATVAALTRFAADHSLSGLEWAGGLPGTVGGAVRGNAGCFGGETKDIIVLVRSVSLTDGAVVERDRSKCAFAYRSSVFKTAGTEVVVEAELQLRPGSAPAIQALTQEHIDYRRAHHPLQYPNIGSIFKNVPLAQFLAGSGLTEDEALKRFPVKTDPFPVVPTAFLISEAGLPGTAHGGAMISPQHPNFIVNTGAATAADVEHLIAATKHAVEQRFGVTLEEEVQRVA